MSENTCPTCHATGDNPCITATGKPAKKNHAARKIANMGEIIAETAKERFARHKTEKRAAAKAKKEAGPQPAPSTETTRERRRRNGMRKTVHRGARRRAKLVRANEQVRAFWHPEPEADDLLTSENVRESA